ncbi:DUF899 domain-containing protein [Sulfitobacter sp. D35]|uniref:DUF899 domain-containing protein n=1 Tax=Sulfitobacter sp. D35 TaxID=3083252 RepID=UPI00296E619D|nr:DUF899 domain-containing protein [Sulfitobacter sp. D35]MDW4496597.1 DUF899 domain-containing protein [Sulfitobacter sp. D35]
MATRWIDEVERRIADADGFERARQSLLEQEKAHTRAGDRIAAARRRLPWVPVTRDYRFEGADGACGLVDLFDGRRQLIVYHHMLRPADPAPCTGCSMVGDQIPHLAHLHARDTSLVFVSRAPITEIAAFRDRMGWAMPWYTTQDSFNADHGVDGGFGVNVFYRDGDDVFRTYFTTARAAESLGTVWSFLDLTPLGRQEKWEDAPEGSPQTPPYRWWRLHDEYEAG